MDSFPNYNIKERCKVQESSNNSTVKEKVKSEIESESDETRSSTPEVEINDFILIADEENILECEYKPFISSVIEECFVCQEFSVFNTVILGKWHCKNCARLQTAILNKDFSALCDSGTEADEIIHIEQKLENLKWSKKCKRRNKKQKKKVFLKVSFPCI